MQSKEFVKKVVDSYQNQKGIFEHRANAEELAPKNCTSKEKALFLFYVLQLDYATKSSRLYEGANKLWTEDKLFFNPNTILKLDEEKLTSTIKNYLKPRYINEAVKRYKHNSKFLLANYGDNPENIFEGSQTAVEALKKTRMFRGFGPKIGNFFVRTMINTFGYSYSDIEDVLPPVDSWDVKIAFLLNYTDSEAMTTKNVNVVKKIWNTACKEAGESWLIFDKALWLLGSEGKPKSKEDILNLIG